jgi:hypothetical protein
MSLCLSARAFLAATVIRSVLKQREATENWS